MNAPIAALLWKSATKTTKMPMESASVRNALSNIQHARIAAKSFPGTANFAMKAADRFASPAVIITTLVVIAEKSSTKTAAPGSPAPTHWYAADASMIGIIVVKIAAGMCRKWIRIASALAVASVKIAMNEAITAAVATAVTCSKRRP